MVLIHTREGVRRAERCNSNLTRCWTPFSWPNPISSTDVAKLNMQLLRSSQLIRKKSHPHLTVTTQGRGQQTTNPMVHPITVWLWNQSINSAQLNTQLWVANRLLADTCSITSDNVHSVQSWLAWGNGNTSSLFLKFWAFWCSEKPKKFFFKIIMSLDSHKKLMREL